MIKWFGFMLIVGMTFAAAPTFPSLTEFLLPGSIILVLVLINGFFVAAEFAIIGVRPSRMEQMADEGNSRALSVQKILASPRAQDQYIATAQLGITIASLGLGYYGEPTVAHLVEPFLAVLLGVEPDAAIVHTISYVLILSVLTYLHVVVGEMVPKSLALAAADRVVLGIYPAMMLAETVLRLPVRILNGIGRGLLKLLRVPPAEGHARLYLPEEIEQIVNESTESGLLNEGEQEIISNILDFGERVVSQVMTPRPKVQAIPYSLSRKELLNLIIQSPHTRFPVYENDVDHIIGILHMKDLVRQQVQMKGTLDIRLILRAAPAVPQDMLVEKLLARFKKQRLHMAVVLDEFGGMAGVVTLEDLVEEIVGEVRDEFDVEKEPLIELEPGILEVTGSYLVDDLQEYIFLGEVDDLPDVDTVGGLIITWLARPPQIGDIVTHQGIIKFTVLDVSGLAVARVKIEFPTTETDEHPPEQNPRHH